MALTIAGSDSSGGAGIEADLRTFHRFGVWGTAAVTAVTAQNHKGVLQSTVLAPGLVVAQVEAVAALVRSMPVLPGRAVKTGMLGDAAVVEATAAVLERHRLGPLVVDPVLSASGGGSLLADDAVPVVARRLLPGCTVFTPNLPEAEVFLGGSISCRADMEEAAAALGRMGPAVVMLKGGHLAGRDAPDAVWDGARICWLEGPRIEVLHSHGTGCTLSAGVAAGLALGMPALDACRAAREHVRSALAALVDPVRP